MLESHVTSFTVPLAVDCCLPPAPFRLAQSLLHTVYTHFLSEQTAAEKLRPLVASLAKEEEALRQLLVQLNAAAQRNNGTRTLLEETNTLLHNFQVTTNTQTQACMHTQRNWHHANDDVL